MRITQTKFHSSILLALPLLLFGLFLAGLNVVNGLFWDGVDHACVVVLYLVQVNRTRIVVLNDPEDDVHRQHGDDGPRERVQELAIRFFLHRMKGVKWMNAPPIFIYTRTTAHSHKR